MGTRVDIEAVSRLRMLLQQARVALTTEYETESGEYVVLDEMSRSVAKLVEEIDDELARE